MDAVEKRSSLRHRDAFVAVATWLLGSISTAKCAADAAIAKMTEEALNRHFAAKFRRGGQWSRFGLQDNFGRAVRDEIAVHYQEASTRIYLPGSCTTVGVFPVSLLRTIFGVASGGWAFKASFRAFNPAIDALEADASFIPFPVSTLATIAAEIRVAVQGSRTTVMRGKHDRRFSGVSAMARTMKIPLDFPFMEDALQSGGGRGGIQSPGTGIVAGSYLENAPGPLMRLVDVILPPRRRPMVPTQMERQRAAKGYVTAINERYTCDLCGQLCSLMEHGAKVAFPVRDLPLKCFVEGSKKPSTRAAEAGSGASLESLLGDRAAGSASGSREEDAADCGLEGEEDVRSVLRGEAAVGSRAAVSLGPKAADDPLLPLRHIRYVGGHWMHGYGPVYDRGPTVDLCSQCAGMVRRPSVPVYSPAGGFDPGRLNIFMERFGLVPLSSLERTLIAPIRLYAEVIMLYPAEATSVLNVHHPGTAAAAAATRPDQRRGPGQRAFRGNVISLPHDGPQVAESLPSSGEDIRVYFVGTTVPKDALRTAVRGFVNGGRVQKWLSALKAINHPAYAAVVVADNVVERVDGVVEQLVDRAEVIDVKAADMAKLRVAVSDVAHARPAIGRTDAEAASAGAPNGVCADDSDPDDGDGKGTGRAKAKSMATAKGKGKAKTSMVPAAVAHLPDNGDVSEELVAALVEGIRAADSSLVQSEGIFTGLGTAERVHTGLVAAFAGAGGARAAVQDDEGGEDGAAVLEMSAGEPSSEEDLGDDDELPPSRSRHRHSRFVRRGARPLSEFAQSLTILLGVFPDLFLLRFAATIPQRFRFRFISGIETTLVGSNHSLSLNIYINIKRG